MQQNEMLNYRLQKAHQKYQQTIENIAAENSKLRNEVKLIFLSSSVYKGISKWNKPLSNAF